MAFIFRGNGGEIVSAVQDVRLMVSDVKEIAIRGEIPIEDAIRHVKSKFDKTTLRRNLVRKLLAEHEPALRSETNDHNPVESAAISPIFSMQSFDTTFSTMYNFMVDRSFQINNKSKLSNSDYSDFMHCGYLPYVDIFSCDKRTPDLIRRASEIYGTEIVSRASMLKDSIEKRLIVGSKRKQKSAQQ